MQEVAEYLGNEAVRHPAKKRGDLFGRSAYNRLYYATFLTVRDLVQELDKDWVGLPHADYPSLLEGQILSKLQAGRRRARKLEDWELDTLCAQAISAVHELAKLVHSGSATRVIADYKPDVKVEFGDKSSFSLNHVPYSEAHAWPRRAGIFCETVAKAWRQLLNE